MMIRSDFYRIALRFPRLFPDPAVFEDQIHIAKRYLVENGLSREKSGLIYQTTDEIAPVDDQGNPSATSGTAKYSFEGRAILAEYMSNATIQFGYADFGTGLSPDDHSKLWTRGKLGELRFELREFKYKSQMLNIPDFADLYRILKEKTMPSSLSTIELDNIPDHAFAAVTAYIDDRLRSAAKNDSLEVEVYAARNLSTSEKAALETRLTRASTKSTVFVILSRNSS